MVTPLSQQEIYLLERFLSLAYFAELRDTWEQMVKHVEACLDAFMRNLPANYRSRSLPEQPDVVWGELVLPNFRDTLQGLISGYIELSHGDMNGLHSAHGPENDFKGQMDYWAEWMPTKDLNLYGDLLIRATTMAGNICATEGADWRPLELSNFSNQRGPLNPPAQFPIYRINPNVAVASGQKTEHNGIYLPDVDNSCAEFLSTKYEQAPRAIVLVGKKDLLHPVTGEKYAEEPVLEKRDCVWHLVERSPDEHVAPPASTVVPTQSHRLAAGEICPENGFYFTPARPGSRRKFQKGDVMPSFDTGYGTTIWQRDSNQA